MEKITRKEEEILQVLWNLEKAFVKEIVAALPDPKPHYNTVSTIVRKLEEKKYVGYEAFGKTHRYFPLIKREDFLGKTMTKYFNNSYKKMVTFFAKEEKLSVEELKEIIKLIEKEKK